MRFSWWNYISLEDVIDRLLESEMTVESFLHPLDTEQNESNRESLAEHVCIAMRAKVGQLLRRARIDEEHCVWADGCLQAESWCWHRRLPTYAVRFKTLYELLEERLRVDAQHPRDEIVRRKNVRELLLTLRRLRDYEAPLGLAKGKLKRSGGMREIALLEALGLVTRRVVRGEVYLTLTLEGLRQIETLKE